MQRVVVRAAALRVGTIRDHGSPSFRFGPEAPQHHLTPFPSYPSSRGVGLSASPEGPFRASLAGPAVPCTWYGPKRWIHVLWDRWLDVGRAHGPREHTQKACPIHRLHRGGDSDASCARTRLGRDSRLTGYRVLSTRQLLQAAGTHRSPSDNTSTAASQTFISALRCMLRQ